MTDKPLSQRMLDAAQTLEEVSALYDYFSPQDGPWSARQLRNAAEHVESEEAEQ